MSELKLLSSNQFRYGEQTFCADPVDINAYIRTGRRDRLMAVSWQEPRYVQTHAESGVFSVVCTARRPLAGYVAPGELQCRLNDKLLVSCSTRPAPNDYVYELWAWVRLRESPCTYSLYVRLFGAEVNQTDLLLYTCPGTLRKYKHGKINLQELLDSSSEEIPPTTRM
jgi:hypothetical protein